MTAGRPPDDEATPAERRLAALLAVLRSAPPTAREGLTASVMWRVRLELVARTFATAVGSFAAALVDGMALLVGPRSPRARPPR